MINKKKDYGKVYAMPGVHYEQDGKLFDNRFYEIDGKGNMIDPAYEPEEVVTLEVTEQADSFAEAVKEHHEVVEPEALEPELELELIDRIKIVDKNMDGYIDESELKEMLDGYGKEYNHRHRRSGLLSMLKQEIGLE